MKFSRKFWVIFLAIAFFVGAAGTLTFDRLIFPQLAKIPGLEFFSKLRSNTPIIITRREEIRLNEGVNLIELIKQTQSAAVAVFSPDGKYLGRGMILTSDGLIFTSQKAIGNQTSFLVSLDDGTVAEAELAAADRKSDAVLLSSQATGRPVVQFGSASELKSGQRVIALGRTEKEFETRLASGLVTKTVGNPGNSQASVSSEIFANSIKTDAVLTPDFLGAPVFNLDGKTVGMVTDANSTILISEYLETALNSYLKQNKILRPYLGMEYQPLTKLQASLRNLPQAGAVIVRLENDSPLKKSGLRAGDYIVSFAGTNLGGENLEAIINRIQETIVGVSVIRNGEEMDFSITINSQ